MTVLSELADPPALDLYGACYDLGARFFLNGPTAVCRKRLPGIAALLDALRDADPNWPARVEALLWCGNQAAELKAAEGAYLRSIVLPVPGRYVPPYASVQLGERMLWGAPAFEAQRLYTEHGLEWQAGATLARPLAPDHLGLELAFLALVHSEAGASSTDEQCASLATFLDAHLLRWLPRYLVALRTARVDSLIAEWVEWLLSVAHHDLDRLSNRR